MNTESQATDHVFLPLIVRAQLITCGVVLAAGAVIGTLGAVDLSTLRALVGA